MNVCGYELTSEEVAVTYAMDSTKYGDKYEAHSDNQVIDRNVD
jgi:hypothetical protein